MAVRAVLGNLGFQLRHARLEAAKLGNLPLQRYDIGADRRRERTPFFLGNTWNPFHPGKSTDPVASARNLFAQPAEQLPLHFLNSDAARAHIGLGLSGIDGNCHHSLHPLMIKTLAHLLWKAVPKSWHWRLLWFAHAKFNIGVVGVVSNEKGAVLLLRHVYRSKIMWELPSGWIQHGETVEEGLCREVLEETGLSVTSPKAVSFKSGYQLRVEFVITGTTSCAQTASCGHEILEARFFRQDSLPPDLKPEHLAHIVTFAGQAHRDDSPISETA